VRRGIKQFKRKGRLKIKKEEGEGRGSKTEVAISHGAKT